MKVHMYKKDYNKESEEVKKAILSSVKDLYLRIENYEKQNVEFNRIFNDDKVKYDKHGDFYTYKSQKANIQLRILYSYFFCDGEPVILIADYYVKKKDKKEYIIRFDSVNKITPFAIFEKSILVSTF